MNVQNGLFPEERENGNNSLTSIVKMESDLTSVKGSQSELNKTKAKSSRGDSTDALLGDDDKLSFDENNSAN